MPDILAGARIKALDFTPSVAFTDTTQIDVTSTTPIASSPVVDGLFVAPTSGRILVTCGGGVSRPSGTGAGFERGHIDYEIYQGTSAGGTLIFSAGNTIRRWTAGGTLDQGPWFSSRLRLLTGLSAGVTYYARVMISRAGDTVGTTIRFHHRTLDISPTT